MKKGEINRSESDGQKVTIGVLMNKLNEFSKQYNEEKHYYLEFRRE